MATTTYLPAPSGGSGAPADATYITQTTNSSLSAEQALASLGTGLVKNTTATGVLSIAVAGTDYAIPSSQSRAALWFAFAKSQYSSLAWQYHQQCIGITAPTAVAVAGCPFRLDATLTGGAAVDATTASGGLTVSTGATAGSRSRVYANGAQAFTDNPKTKVWFAYARAAIGGFGADNTALISPIWLTNTNLAGNSLLIGIRGATSVTNISMWTEASVTAVDTGQAWDAAVGYHDFAMGFDGATLTAFYGDITSGSLTALATITDLTNFLSTSAMLTFGIRNGTRAANENLFQMELGFCGPQQA